MTLHEAGRLDDALELSLRFRAMVEKTMGPSPVLSEVVTSIGVIYRGLGRPEDASRELETAIKMQRALGQHGSAAANTHVELGHARLEMDQVDDALGLYSAALNEFALGSEPASGPTAAEARMGIAKAHLARNEAATALPHAEAAVALGQVSLPPEYPLFLEMVQVRDEAARQTAAVPSKSASARKKQQQRRKAKKKK